MLEEETMAHPNEATIRKGYEAFATGDMDTFRNEIFTEDVVWSAPGKSPISGDYKGVDEVLTFYGRIAELTAGSFRAVLKAASADDEVGFGLHQASATRDGKSYEGDEVIVFRFRGGKVSEGRLYAADLYAADEFWA